MDIGPAFSGTWHRKDSTTQPLNFRHSAYHFLEEHASPFLTPVPLLVCSSFLFSPLQEKKKKEADLLGFGSPTRISKDSGTATASMAHMIKIKIKNN